MVEKPKSVAIEAREGTCHLLHTKAVLWLASSEEIDLGYQQVFENGIDVAISDALKLLFKHFSTPY